MLAETDFLLVESKLAILSRPTGVSAYDFNFSLHFNCSHPYRIETETLAIPRIGAPKDYALAYMEAAAADLRSINDPEQHLLASDIEHWYPRITDVRKPLARHRMQ